MARWNGRPWPTIRVKPNSSNIHSISPKVSQNGPMRRARPMDEHEAREGVQTAGTRRGYLPFLAEPALRAFSLRSNTVQEGGHQAVGSTTRLFIHVHGTAGCAAARPPREPTRWEWHVARAGLFRENTGKVNRASQITKYAKYRDLRGG